MPLLTVVITHFLNLIARLLDFIAPRPCAVCGKRLGIGETVICSVCNRRLPRTYFSKNAYENSMAKTFWGRMPVERAAAWFYYEPQAETSRIIYSFKYRNHPEHAELTGRVIAAEIAADGFFSGIDAIVPVPLSRKRQRSRGYNQSFEIAKGISQITGLPVIKNAVIRKTFRDSQTRKHRWQRIENVENVFELKKADALRGKHILIIDDVITTGSTIISCANEIKKCGDVKFSILSVGFTRNW